MKKYLLPFVLLALAPKLYANPLSQPESIYKSAAVTAAQDNFKTNTKQSYRFDIAQLKQNQQLTEQLLNLAIDQDNAALLQQLLPIYAQFAKPDQILQLFAQAQLSKLQRDYATAVDLYQKILTKRPDLNPVRVEFAIALFEDRQNRAAEQQFRQATAVKNLPVLVRKQIERYLTALEKREQWQIDFSAYYLREDNVNNASPQKTIDNPYLPNLTKNPSMLPQKAEGFGYGLNIQRYFNLYQNHYAYVENALQGKIFWNNHQFDDHINRTSLGYAYQSAVQKWQVLPFYQRRWYGGHRYNKSHGVRLEQSYWLNAQWQWSNALEYGRHRYHNVPELDGNNHFISSTIAWQTSARQLLYFGLDFNHEKTQQKQYSNRQKTLRLGWVKHWQLGIASRLSFSLSKKSYAAPAKIGAIPLGKIREDKIYQANLSLWNPNWHLWHITPKLQFSWYKQQSNIPSLYSYQEKKLNLLFEKSF